MINYLKRLGVACPQAITLWKIRCAYFDKGNNAMYSVNKYLEGRNSVVARLSMCGETNKISYKKSRNVRSESS